MLFEIEPGHVFSITVASAYLGFASVILVAGNIIWLAKKYKEIALAIASAFVFRISAAIINLYVVPLLGNSSQLTFKLSYSFSS